MTEEELDTAQRLKGVLAEHKDLLVNYEALLPLIKEAGIVAGNYRAIESALQYGTGEAMVTVDRCDEESIKQGRSEVERILQANYMLPGRISFIVNIFDYALGWTEVKAANTWRCSVCGEENSFKFCEYCGARKPAVGPELWSCPSCGMGNTGGRFCTNCGTAKDSI